MKRPIYLIFIFGFIILGWTFLRQNGLNKYSRKAFSTASYSTNKNLHKATLSIKGMWCASCAVGAQYSLKNLEGVTEAYVGLTKDLRGEGWIIYDPEKVPKEQIIKAVEPYKAKIVSDIIYN